MPFLPPNVSEEMLKADFWIEKLTDVDRVLATAAEIELLR